MAETTVQAEHGHSAATGQAGRGELAHHFSSIERQSEALKLGMWLFLSTEILLFAGLFCGYSVYRFEFPLAFQEASRHINLTLGTINTVVLITSSFTVALAIHFVKIDKQKLAVFCLALTILMALGFLGIKSVEYLEKFREGAYPGKYYRFEEVRIPGAAMYFTLYFLMTGLHALHIIIGMTVLAILAVKTWRGAYGSDYYTGLEMGGLYWHLVDLIWIFLYPLLYLI